MRPKSPCKDCEKRNEGCHSRCPDYLDFRSEVEKIKETREEIRPIKAYFSRKSAMAQRGRIRKQKW